MNQLVNIEKAKKISYSVSLCFLLIHVGMIVLFGAFGIKPMFYFNIFSIAFYIASLYVIHRGWFPLFVLSTYFEVILHMTLAVLVTGWDAGFQVTLIGLSMLAFFSEYLQRVMQLRYVLALPLCIAGMIAYLGSYLISAFHPAPYPLPGSVVFWLNIIWGFITFLISISCLQTFTMISFRSEELLSSQVTTDALTGLPNRYYVSLCFKDYSRAGGWVAMLDIDDFKHINDTYGHQFGDFVLKTVARLMREQMADAEACRWGGEEFLFFGCAEDVNAQGEALDCFRAVLENYPFSDGEHQTHLTITIGLAPYEEGMSLSEWINTADKKLYLGKRSGKNQVVI